jgi:hypothetical protein
MLDTEFRATVFPSSIFILTHYLGQVAYYLGPKGWFYFHAMK